MQNVTDNYLVWATDFNKIPYYQISKKSVLWLSCFM